MSKAIDIKRRAQRAVQTGDLDGALTEYRKLVAAEDADPYNFVLLADLLYKKGETEEAGDRYLEAAQAYQGASLYKNGIAVCKKMLRLQLRPGIVLERLGELHALDGLATEALLYYSQHADLMLREDKLADGAKSLRKAFDACTDDVRVLERLAQVLELQGDHDGAAQALLEAAQHFDRRGQGADAQRARGKAREINPRMVENEAKAPRQAAPPEPGPSVPAPPGAATVAASLPPEDAPSAPPVLELERRVFPTAGAAPPTLEPELNGPGADVERLEIDSGIGLQWEPAAGETGPPALNPGPPPLVPEVPEAESHFPETEDATHEHDAAAGLPAARIETLLAQAQEAFRRGDRDGATAALLEAAEVYEAINRFEDAATIYRNLGKSPRVPDRALRRWLANSERRGDGREAAEVACELGDRALGRGDEVEARHWFEQAIAMDETCEQARRRMQRLEAMNAAQTPKVEVREGKLEVSSSRSDASNIDLSALLSEFERGLEQQLSGDAQGHYDLAMTYREMGLLDQAIEAFQKAGSDPAYALRSAEMAGRCLLDQGRFSEAVVEFAHAIAMPNTQPEAMLGIRFQLGLAYEAAGQPREALQAFQAVFAVQPSYPDVAVKIRVLKKALEAA